MDTSEIGVVIGGTALIAFVWWYFFGERESTAVKKAADLDVSSIQVDHLTERSPERFRIR